MKPYRKISILERSYLFHDALEHTRMSICNVYEGEGSFDLQSWNDAIAKAAEKHPGSRLVKRGHLGWSKWIDTGIAPKARLVDFSNWDGITSKATGIFTAPLNVNEGPTFEVMLLEGNPLRVCFRSHHATMDAAGIIIFTKDIFRALRGEPVIGSNSTLSDIDFLQTLNRPEWPIRKPPAIAPTGSPRGDDLNCSWRIVRVKGKQKGLVAKLALAARKSAKRYSGQDPVIRSRITVDLRRHLSDDIVSTANLSSAFDVSVAEHDTVESVTQKITDNLNNRLECALPHPLILGLAPWVPTKFSGMPDISIRRVHQKGGYARSGTVSNIGLINREDFSGGGFNAKSGFTIPTLFKLSPYFITSTGDVDGCNILIVVPNCLGSDGRLEQFAADIEETLLN